MFPDVMGFFWFLMWVLVFILAAVALYFLISIIPFVKTMGRNHEQLRKDHDGHV